MPVTVSDAAHSVTATARLRTLNKAGLLDGSDCVVAARIARLVGEDVDGEATLALAFAVRAVREGSTALSLDSIASLSAGSGDDGVGAAPAEGALGLHLHQQSDPGPTADADVTVASLVDLPDPVTWLDTVRTSRLVAEGVLRVDLGLVYLDRYHADECLIADSLEARAAASVTPVDADVVAASLSGEELDATQESAVWRVAEHATTVLTGGPGMGKTHTIGKVLEALAAASGGTLRMGLSAPTGKAAARLNESLGHLAGQMDSIGQAVTLHRLLGSRPDSHQRFQHDARNPLPHDVVVVDEASMVSLSLMARLIEALSPTARLLLVGDPDQLASVEAGSVLADLVTGLEQGDGVVRLTRNYRLDDDRASLAQSFRAGDVEAVQEVLTRAAAGHAKGVTFRETDEPSLDEVPEAAEHAQKLRELALRGDAEGALAHLGEFRLLCAHRTGPFGTRHWNRLVEHDLAEQAPEVALQPMYIGRPLLVTRNDYGLGVSNGDTGVIVSTDNGPLAVIETGSGLQHFAPWRLADVETMHAMTVHKAQGSQASRVAVIVPPLGSRLLTRELLYTAVTRAQDHLMVVGARNALGAAVQSPAQRSSGLAHRLAPSAPPRP